MVIIEKKDILVLGQQSTDGLDVTKITAKAKFFVNITKSRRKSTLQSK